MLTQLFKNKLYFYSIIAIIIYFVGIIGLTLFPDLFKPITPLNLFLSALFILNFDNSPKKNIVFYVFITILLGWSIEWLGVNSKVIFGEYTYGPTLGLQIDEIPLFIGVNWFILSYCSANLSQWILPKNNLYIKTTLGAFFMVGLDVLIEPLCKHLDFWYWKNDVIPLQNFLAWFVFSWGFIFMFFILKIDANNKASRLLYMLQTIFFLTLLMFYTYNKH